MTFLAPIDRATAAPIPRLLTDEDFGRAAEGRAMAEDIDAVLSRAPVRPVDPAFGIVEFLCICAALSLLALALAILLPMVVWA